MDGLVRHPDLRRLVKGLRTATLAVPLWLSVAVGVAVALRFSLLTDESFWGDEGVSVAVARLDVVGIARFASDSDTHPPLYYALLHYWIGLLGDSEFAVRSLSAVFGVLAVPCAFALARELTRSAGCGVAAAFLVAASPIGVEYSQEARMYALLALAAGVSSLCLARLVRAPSATSAVVYALTLAATLYSHAYGLFVLCAHAVYVLCVWRIGALEGGRPLCRVLAGGAAGLALFAPWGVVMVRQGAEEVARGDGAKLAWLDAPGPGDVWRTAVHWWGAPALVVVAGVIAVLVAALGVSGWPRPHVAADRERAAGHAPLFLLGALTLVPLVLPYLVSSLTSLHIYLYRYTTASAFFFTVLMAVLAFRLQRPLHVLTVGALFATLFAGSVAYLARPDKTDVRSAVSFLQPDAGPADLIVVEPSWQWQVVHFYLPPARGEFERELRLVTPKRLEATKARGGDVWVLHTYELTGVPSAGRLTEQIAAVYGRPRIARFHGIEVRRFE